MSNPLTLTLTLTLMMYHQPNEQINLQRSRSVSNKFCATDDDCDEALPPDFGQEAKILANSEKG